MKTEVVPPDHKGPCRPWHKCSWCPCKLDNFQTHDAHNHAELAAWAKENGVKP